MTVSALDPATAAIRVAVRRTLGECAPGDLVLVGCSGGADSLALADAVAFEAPRLAVRAGAVVVDHALQEGSDAVADSTAETLSGMGLDPVEVVVVEVRVGPGGLEAAARESRYAALGQVADRRGARLLLLGHTLDDQAEQVLLGLTRGAGARSLSGMPPVRGRLRRPLLGITRAQTHEACTRAGLQWWDDPMNEDPAHTRVRVRRWLTDLEEAVGPGVRSALARTADQLRVDADHLDALADAEADRLGSGPFPVAELSGIPEAVRGRVWRRLLVRAGAPAGQVSTRHTEACDALLTDWHGQGPIHVPGPLEVGRSSGRVLISSRTPVEWAHQSPPTPQE